MPEIKITNLKVGYVSKKSENIVFEKFSATFDNNKINVILGDSGCGKTTLLKTIIGFYSYEGKIYFDGKDVEDTSVQDRNIAYVSQNLALYSHLTVFDNIAFPLKIMHADRQEIITRVTELARRLGIEMCLTRKPKVLSGGQLQRVAIARALIKRPSIILFDEPLSNLDPQTSESIRPLIKELAKEFSITVIYVTHSLENAFALADKILVIRDGKVVLEGTPEEFVDSNDEILKYFRKYDTKKNVKSK